MFEEMPLSVRLVKSVDSLFDELQSLLKRKQRVGYVLNLLIGLLDKNMPLYYLSDIPEYQKLRQNRDEYRSKAINFLYNNFELLLGLLSYKELEDEERENLIYMLGKYAKELNLEPKYILMLGFLTLDLLIEYKDRLKIAKQLLCRYDFGCLVKEVGAKECDKLPYEEIIGYIKDKSSFEYGELYLAISKDTIVTNSKEFDKNELITKAKEILDSIAVQNYEEILLAIEKCLYKDKFDISKESKNITQTQSISKSEDMTLQDFSKYFE